MGAGVKRDDRVSREGTRPTSTGCHTVPAHARIAGRYVAGHLSITDDPSRTIARDTADRDACYLVFTLDARYQTPPEPTAEDRAAAAANEAYWDKYGI